MKENVWKRFELKIVAMILCIVLSLSLCFYLMIYEQYFQLTIDNLKQDARMIHQYVEEVISEDSFQQLNTVTDERKALYLVTHAQLDKIRRIANILYLYTAKQNAEGEYIYVVDGLDRKSEDFRHIGDLIEPEIIPELQKCLNNETVLDDRILDTEWGIVYVTYFPVHDHNGNVIGAIGMEFDCETLYHSFNQVKALTIAISIVLAVGFITVAILVLKRVVRGTEAILWRKDQMLIAAREEALESSRAKSEFLSRMSHEIRTPMNAIIGMTAIADNTNDVNKIKYCLSTISASSDQLLSLINDVLDMSKIEAGKFVLNQEPFNVEKMLMKVCNLVIDKTEQKRQKFDVFLDSRMHLHYLGDELRLSQVITNLLSNAVKFTPENGTITLRVKELREEGEESVLRFSVSDTGIGMAEDQLDKLFESFEQADGSISRKFGGTGLGLSISKSLVEKMGGAIRVDSEPGMGSVFSVEVKLTRLPHQDRAIIFDGISPDDLRVLFVDGDEDTRRHFTDVMQSFGIRAEVADCAETAYRLLAEARDKTYDVIFIDYHLPDKSGFEAVDLLMSLVDKNTAIIMVSFLEWSKIEEQANRRGIRRFITKPLFPSSILDAINEVIGNALKKLEIEAAAPEEQLPDLSGLTLLLVEDIAINREIVLALLEETGATVDLAENGLEAVERFREAPERYAMILMDIQMPEMDGYEATRVIRELALPRSETIPIVAMTANAFREDIERCLENGMNAHLAKPINLRALMEKILYYSNL